MGGKLLKSTSVVAGMTMLSRIMGFVRDVILAQIFGAGAMFDAYVVAFKIPNFLRRLFAEGAFAQAFVPIMAEFRERESEERLREFVNRVAGTLGLVLMMVVVLAEIIAPLIIMVFAPGFLKDPMRLHLATHMLRITFPYLLLVSLTAFMGAMLNTFGKFAIPSFTPVLLNVSLVIAAWFIAPHATTPIYVLAWGVVVGGVAQLLFQLPSLKKLNILPIPKLGFKDPGVRRVMRLMIPALFGVSVAQLSLLIDNFFASFLPAGSISWLYYSDRLTYLPLGVIGVALSTVVMPYLSRDHSSRSTERYSATLDWALRCVVLIGMPAAAALFVLAGPLLATLIQHGAFSVRDVMMTRQSLMAFSIGLPAFMLVKVLASGFYSQQNIKTPVKVAAIAMLCNLILNLILVGPLLHAGLALATSIAAFVNAGLLCWYLCRQKRFQPRAGWVPYLVKVVLSVAVMVVILFWLSGATAQWVVWDKWRRVWHLAYVIVAGGGSYLLALYIVGIRKRHFRPPVYE